jgi:hypothetical protein
MRSLVSHAAGALSTKCRLKGLCLRLSLPGASKRGGWLQIVRLTNFRIVLLGIEFENPSITIAEP